VSRRKRVGCPIVICSQTRVIFSHLGDILSVVTVELSKCPD